MRDVDSGVVGAVDCGTNSTRLLVARRASDGSLETIERLMTITRLGQDVDRTGRLASDAIARTVSVLADYHEVLARHGATAVRASATSAARDAANRSEFFDAASEALGSELELLAGDEEGRLSFQGAMADMPSEPGGVLVFDIGGGSTELIWGSLERVGEPVVYAVRSLDVGCVRVTERWLAADPPTATELEAASSALRSQVDAAITDMGVTGVRRFVGLAGTVSALAAIEQGLGTYDRNRIHHHRLTADSIAAMSRDLATRSVADRLGVPGLEPARAGVIVGGCLVLEVVMEVTGASSVVHSEADILDGLAASLLADDA